MTTEKTWDSGIDGMEGETRLQFIERMQAEGHNVRVPNANQLFVDIDTEEQYATHKNALAILERNGVEFLSIEEMPSKSGLPRRHITITLPFDVDVLGRIAWQAVLGSDLVRELVSCVRHRHGQILPTLFIEPKEQPVAQTAEVQPSDEDLLA